MISVKFERGHITLKGHARKALCCEAVGACTQMLTTALSEIFERDDFTLEKGDTEIWYDPESHEQELFVKAYSLTLRNISWAYPEEIEIDPA